jgi:hypothetical protein
METASGADNFFELCSDEVRYQEGPNNQHHWRPKHSRGASVNYYYSRRGRQHPGMAEGEVAMR